MNSYVRAELIIKRISRDRWLSPDDLLALCMKCSDKYGGLTRYYLDRFSLASLHAVGIWQGQAPCLPGDTNYSQTYKAIKKSNKKDGASTEIAILSTSIKSINKRMSIYD